MKGTASPAELLIRVDRSAPVSLRAQLERELRRAIQTGRLEAGLLLPATRTLAADLGLSRELVVEAYEQLHAEGYLTAHRGSATRVARRPPGVEWFRRNTRSAQRSPGTTSGRACPISHCFPRRAWSTAVRRALSVAADSALDYPDPRGPERARVVLAAYLNRVRATQARPDRIVFSSGAAQGIGLLGRLLYTRGVRRVAVEEPGHADQCTDIRAAGLETPRIPVDEHGIRVDRPNRVRAGAVRVTPAHQ